MDGSVAVKMVPTKTLSRLESMKTRPRLYIYQRKITTTSLYKIKGLFHSGCHKQRVKRERCDSLLLSCYYSIG